jgi:hypothetical protein
MTKCWLLGIKADASHYHQCQLEHRRRLNSSDSAEEPILCHQTAQLDFGQGCAILTSFLTREGIYVQAVLVPDRLLLIHAQAGLELLS